MKKNLILGTLILVSSICTSAFAKVTPENIDLYRGANSTGKIILENTDDFRGPNPAGKDETIWIVNLSAPNGYEATLDDCRSGQ